MEQHRKRINGRIRHGYTSFKPETLVRYGLIDEPTEEKKMQYIQSVILPAKLRGIRHQLLMTENESIK